MIKKLVDSFRLKNEREDLDAIHYTMERGIVFRGTNLWVLIFAIFIASVGLNINSTAVIIGAMLVSPLMGPILGMGYSLATYDFTLFRKSVSNYLFAIGAGLVTSTIYFFLSPFNEAHSELLARIRPNIYDVLVALFGGLAGILAISSKNKGNVVAGVAIATALMPPLCTAGYGLGTGKWNFFFGAFYLLTINTVFIALATLLTTRFLKFPIVPQINERHKVAANRWVTVIVLLTIIPSLYFGYLLVQQEKFTRSANEFIRNETLIEGDYLLKSEIKPLQKEIHLIYGGRAITEEEKKQIESRTKAYKMDNVKLVFGLGFSISDINEDLTETEKLNAEINRLRSELAISRQKQDSIIQKNLFGAQLLSELRPLFSDITLCSASEQNFFSDSSHINKYYVVVVSAKNISRINREKNKINGWLKARLKTDSVKLFIQRQ